MTISRVKVGLPVDNSRRLRRGGLKWGGQVRAPKEPVMKVRFRTVRARPLGEGDSPAPPQAAPNLAVKPLSRLTSRQFVFLTVLALAAVLLVAGLVRSNHLAVEHSYDLSALTQQKLRLLETNRQLKTELARVSSLDQLEKTARASLGLITPQKGQIVVID